MSRECLMNIPHIDPERKCRVTKDYQAEFPDPIAVEAGEAFAVSEGNSGWVPKNIIQMGADGLTGTTPAAYNARELTVIAGQELTIEQEESGWFWCHDQQGKRGWVPLSHVQEES